MKKSPLPGLTRQEKRDVVAVPSALRELLDKVEATPGCRVLWKPEGRSVVNVAGHEVLPEDLQEFVSLTDGVELFLDKLFPLYIHGAAHIVRANPIIVGDDCSYDRSYHWYVIANDGNGDYMSIDLARERAGRCYDSFHECHGISGSCAIIASSFTDLLVRAVRNGGRRWWWLQPDFHPLGDAYDN